MIRLEEKTPAHLLIRSSAHRVSTLTLTHFRNHPALALSAEGKSVVITGANGAGKTNILEALSLFAPGKGLRGAKLSQLRHQHSNHGWAVSLELMNSTAQGAARSGRGSEAKGGQAPLQEKIQLGTGQHPNGGEKRLLRCNGEPLASQAELAQHLCILWQTPQMDGLFTHSASEQRRFFDRLVTGFDPEHAARIARYEYYMRERNKLMSGFGIRDSGAWLTAIEHKMAEASTAIAAARLEALHHLQAAMGELHSAFPQAEIQLEGFAETALESHHSALEVEDKLAAQLAASRHEDAATGRSSYGAHKMELRALHNEKQMPAALCSTGEQKALLLSLLLAQTLAIHRCQGRLPVLLLDEVVAHLDATRRAALFDALTELSVQAWLTGTDAELFEGFAAERFVLRSC